MHKFDYYQKGRKHNRNNFQNKWKNREADHTVQQSKKKTIINLPDHKLLHILAE
jgi:hypothetical protein